MRKIFLIVALMAGFSVAASAKEQYKLNDSQVDQMFAQANDISMVANPDGEMINSVTSTSSSSMMVGGGEKTKGGYFLRLIFCGWIGLHRSYMGTGGKSVWCYYLIPCYNTLLFIGDFWVVLFKSGQWEKYKNNSHVNVWLAK